MNSTKGVIDISKPSLMQILDSIDRDPFCRRQQLMRTGRITRTSSGDAISRIYNR
jgi:hypothetical protein